MAETNIRRKVVREYGRNGRIISGTSLSTVTSLTSIGIGTGNSVIGGTGGDSGGSGGSGGSSSTTWGNIQGILSDQEDLQLDLDGKAAVNGDVGEDFNADTLTANSILSSGGITVTSSLNSFSTDILSISEPWVGLDAIIGPGTSQDSGLEIKTDLGVTSKLYRKASDGDWYIDTKKILLDGDSPTTSWGDIIGTLSDQTDLQNALDAKANVNGNSTENFDVATLDVYGDLKIRGEVLNPTGTIIPIDDAWVRLNNGNTEVDSGIQVEIDGAGTVSRLYRAAADDKWRIDSDIIAVNSGSIQSNLNADLLDGQHGSHYLDFNNSTNLPSPTITLSGDATGSGVMTNLGSTTITVDVNDSSALGGISASQFVRNDTGLTDTLYQGAWVSTYGSVSDIDHIWHNDTNNEFHFVSGGTFESQGNSTLVAGSVHVSDNLWAGAGTTYDLDIRKTDTEVVGRLFNLAVSGESKLILHQNISVDSFNRRAGIELTYGDKGYCVFTEATTAYANDRKFHIGAGTTLSTSGKAITVDYTNKVGINNISPSQALDVIGNIVASLSVVATENIQGTSFKTGNGGVAVGLNSTTVQIANSPINVGGVELYHNQSKKLETTSTGVDVTGELTENGNRVVVDAPDDNKTYSRRSEAWLSDDEYNATINVPTGTTSAQLQALLDAHPRDLHGGTITVNIANGTYNWSNINVKFEHGYFDIVATNLVSPITSARNVNINITDAFLRGTCKGLTIFISHVGFLYQSTYAFYTFWIYPDSLTLSGCHVDLSASTSTSVDVILNPINKITFTECALDKGSISGGAYLTNGYTSRGTQTVAFFKNVVSIGTPFDIGHSGDGLYVDAGGNTGLTTVSNAIKIN